jgi:hypothetical protein
MIRFVVQHSSVLRLQSVWRALVIVIEERDERSLCLRQQRIARFRDSSVRTVANNAHLVMRPLDFS